ncbi:MAG: DUF547 domain-containing protein [Planctomycetota bacterium]
MTRTFSAAPFAALCLALLGLVGCAAAPQMPPDVRLPTYSAEPFAAVLDASVRDGLIDYAAIVDEPDTLDDLDGKLDIYLNALARFGPERTPELFPTEADELAYYLNAYNAVMLRLWLDKGARQADGDEKVFWGTWFTVNQWRIDGRSMSLDYLEQRLIRPRYEEPRIHAALVCGAVDCPPMLDEPFVGERLDEQLDGRMRAWLHDPAEDGLRVTEDGRVYLSRIFGWYRDDFRESGGFEAMIEQYLDDSDPRKAVALAAIRENRLRFLRYDWTINLAPRPLESAAR